MTSSAAEKVLKYIDLETSRGYDNRAVMGGLERAAETWQQEASQSGVEEEAVAEVASTLRSYPTLPPEARPEVLRALRARLFEMEAGQAAAGPGEIDIGTDLSPAEAFADEVEPEDGGAPEETGGLPESSSSDRPVARRGSERMPAGLSGRKSVV